MSSSDVAIAIRGISKAYRIAHGAQKHYTLAEAALARLKNPFERPSIETFWALKDVSFDVKRGDVVGIIGRNGAGKSTLLKILSRITEPTAGEVDLYGRVGSLLEVGTGFHAELTGRENIFINGAMLGMRKSEIRAQFDSIVDFSGVEKFLDTPVKRYSSGMYVRLAFAVAAHLTPDILIVDEVLAVGDAAFQQKCIGKMSEVARGGRTVLFVSHSMAAVSNLCTVGVVLDSGRVAKIAETSVAIAHYNASARVTAGTNGDVSSFRPSWARPVIRSVRLIDENGETASHIPLDSDLTVEMVFDTGPGAPLKNPVMGLVVNHLTYGSVGGVNMMMTGPGRARADGPVARARMQCVLRRPRLVPGSYHLDIWLTDGHERVDMLAGYPRFEIEAADVYGTGQAPRSDLGATYFEPEWTMETVSEMVPSP
ncbi:MAG TPA: polysaccharide ABC transporter ATP-binding protein [Humisphaera sp.]|jgi:lipopolysaccharide transport system ATP-binding protein|nr:polysaccharide ABC transporter ATP-binding protein [Humisphaera sp.]